MKYPKNIYLLAIICQVVFSFLNYFHLIKSEFLIVNIIFYCAIPTIAFIIFTSRIKDITDKMFLKGVLWFLFFLIIIVLNYIITFMNQIERSYD